MTIGLIAALDEEIAYIKRKVPTDETVSIYGSDFLVGRFGGHRVIAGCCSVGTINAAVCTSALIREQGADCIINIGIAGALDSRLRVLDTVISDKLAFHDADNDILKKYYPKQAEYPADENLARLCAECMDEAGQPCHRGLILSGDSFVNSAAEKQDIVGRFENALCVEMEGAAIGQVSFMNETPFLVIRTISDQADGSADMDYDVFIHEAAPKSAAAALRLMEKL